MSDIDRALFHAIGNTADGKRKVYKFAFVRMRDESGNVLGYAWKCDCGRCKSIRVGPFETEKAAREHVNNELAAVLDDIKSADVIESGPQ